MRAASYRGSVHRFFESHYDALHPGPWGLTWPPLGTKSFRGAQWTSSILHLSESCNSWLLPSPWVPSLARSRSTSSRPRRDGWLVVRSSSTFRRTIHSAAAGNSQLRLAALVGHTSRVIHGGAP